MPTIHPTAIVEPGAELADGVSVGPYCVIGAGVKIGAGTALHSHVVVAGLTEIGADCVIHPFAAVGTPPQDLKYKGEESRLTIGERNVIRENVTINPGTEGGGLLTSIGDGNLFMVGAHVGHDCRIGSNAILVNNATLAGHVEVADHAILGGLSAVHQFVRIGAHAMIGGMTGVEHDVIPFGLVTGNRARLKGLNLVGLKRRGFSDGDIRAMRRVYAEIFEGSGGTLKERIAAVAERDDHPIPVKEMLAFLQARSQRSFCTPTTGE